MAIKVYNTLTRKKEEFKPSKGKKVNLFVCGITPYDYAHIGHLRKYINDDILVRVLKANNYDVKHVMNITDVGHLSSDADHGDTSFPSSLDHRLSICVILRKLRMAMRVNNHGA